MKRIDVIDWEEFFAWAPEPLAKDVRALDDKTGLIRDQRLFTGDQLAYLLITLMAGKRSVRLGQACPETRQNVAEAAKGLATTHPDVAKEAVRLVLA